MAFFTTSDGVKLYYEMLGAGGTTLVFCHGLMDSHATFKELAGAYTDRFKVLVFDQRAHGQSDATSDDYSMARFAQDLHELILHLGIDSFVLMGYSMGVHVLFDYVDQFGEDGIKAYVLSVMSPKLLTDDNYKLGLYGNFTQADADKRVETTERMFWLMKLLGPALYTGDKKYKKLVAPYYKRAKHLKKGPMVQVNKELAKGDYWATLDKMTKPTLVIAGENDYYPVAAHEAVHARLKDSELKIIPDAGHMVAIERPEEYVKEVAAFLEKFA